VIEQRCYLESLPTGSSLARMILLMADYGHLQMWLRCKLADRCTPLMCEGEMRVPTPRKAARLDVAIFATT
jgi:hypothetical protein